MKKIGLERLSKRIYLLQTLARAGCLYGVEIWGLKRRELVEKMQGKYVKMILGLNRTHQTIYGNWKRVLRVQFRIQEKEQ